VEERIFSDVFGKIVCGRLSAPVRQRNSRADFAGLDGDVAQVGKTNGWIGNQA
jgi:nitrogenase subunit NifH